MDEDMSLNSFLYDDPEPVGVARIFRKHPELNVSVIARHLGVKQSFLAAYISENEKSSKEREKEIINAVKQVGQELIDA